MHYQKYSMIVAPIVIAFFCLGPIRAGAEQKEYCSSSTGNVGNGYHYEYWSAGGGSACMTVYGVDARFKTNWSSSGDFLARVGLRYNETKTPDQIGNFYSDFEFTKTAGGGMAYIGVYGWTNNPLIEYYIIEDWWSPWTSAPSIGTKKGSITVDGGVFAVYQNTRTGASIHGDNVTFTQYYSIRQKGRQSGRISISQHFAKWDSLGMTMGKLYEVKLLAEGMNNGSGTVDFTKATVVVGDPTGVSFVPQISRVQRPFSVNGNANGVPLLVSLNGRAAGPLQQNRPDAAVGSSAELARGMYLLQVRGEEGAPGGRSLLVK